ncbi:hypothetical protein XPA_001674 [Xanthoria parietina]
MHLTTTTTLLALALSISTSATSIPTFRTEIMPSPTMSPSASRIDTSTPLIDSSTNFTVPQRGTGGPARPESLCHGISPMCYAIAHGKRDCHEAWMQYDDEAYYCDYTSRVSGACTAVLECGGGGKVKQGTCFQGRYVKEVFRRVHAGGFHCGNGGCGRYDIPASEIPEGKDTCGVKLDYCFNCHEKNKEPPTEPLEGYYVVPLPPVPLEY